MSPSKAKTVSDVALAAFAQWQEESEKPVTELTHDQKEVIRKVSDSFFHRAGVYPKEASSSMVSPNRFTADELIIEFEEEAGISVRQLHYSVVLQCSYCGKEVVHPVPEDNRDLIVQLGEAIAKANFDLNVHIDQAKHKPQFEERVIDYLEAIDHKLAFIAEHLTTDSS